MVFLMICGKGINCIKSVKNELIMIGIGKERLKLRERSKIFDVVFLIVGYYVIKYWSCEGLSLIE